MRKKNTEKKFNKTNEIYLRGEQGNRFENDNRLDSLLHAGERAALTARITELQEKLNLLEER